MIPLPQLSKALKGSDPSNPFNGRWRQWYVDIADWMIANPGGKLSDCARDLGRHLNTISFIYRSDIFRDYYSQRRAEHSAAQDAAVRAKLTGVALKSLDLITEQMEKKGDQVPMKLLAEVATGALDRLGYAPATPGTSVNVNVGPQVTQVAVSASALAEARDAMREAERRRAIEHVEAPRAIAPLARGAEPGLLVADLELEAEDGAPLSD